jgi:hypothetical protein
MNNKKTLFLGGTCAGSDWRNKLIPLLDTDKILYHNPVIVGREWTVEDGIKEKSFRDSADYKLYVLTPRMMGVFAIAELTNDSCKNPAKTLFMFQEKDGELLWGTHIKKSLEATAALLTNNGAKQFNTLEEIAAFLNK